MTGYTVHTGTSLKFSEGWNRIFDEVVDTKKSGAAAAKKSAQPTTTTAKKRAAKSSLKKARATKAKR